MKLIGGQTHVRCNVHKKPLIVSYKKEYRCECGKISNYCCYDEECNTRLCKTCFKAYNTNVISFVNPLGSNDNDEERNSTISVNESVIDDTLSSDDEDEFDNEGRRMDIPIGQNISEEVYDNYVTISDENELLCNDEEMARDNILNNNNDDDSVTSFFIPTTNSGDVAVEVSEKVKYGFSFSGSNILNNAGALLTRSTYDIKKSKYVNHHLQKMCSVVNGNVVPLLYPEGILFPSIHWKSASDNCAVVGAIPSSLLNANITKEGFASVQQHIRSRLTAPFCATSSYPRYISHCYDLMANLAASQSDTRLIINRGLTVGNDSKGNLQVRGSKDSSLLGSVDSKQIVKNLYTSQKFLSWSYFLTFTANQDRHFGLKPIKKWLKHKG